MKKLTGKYFLDRDESSHWYLVPENKYEEWHEFLAAFDEVDEIGLKRNFPPKPEGVIMINSPFSLTFENPVIP